jgi:DNA-binding transcriptional regulator YiaG
MKTPIPARIGIEPPVYRSASDLPLNRGRCTSLVELCEQAGIPLRYEGPARQILVYRGRKSMRTPAGDAVGVPVDDLTSPLAALRALEVLAYSFFDYGARACVTHRGLFTTPTPDENATGPTPDPATIRRRLGLTQRKFAALCGIPLSTVRNWEQGRTRPTGAALSLLRVLDSEPEAAVRALASGSRRFPGRRSRG